MGTETSQSVYHDMSFLNLGDEGVIWKGVGDSNF